MKKTLLLVIFTIFLFTACLPVEEQVEELVLLSPTATRRTSELSDESHPIATDFVQTTEPQIATLMVTEESKPEAVQITCDGNFCTQAWPGWLERPFGEGETRTIDRSYPYGSRGGGDLDLHYGVEFLNRHGTPVLAAQAGNVVFSGTDEKEKLGAYYDYYGNVIVLQHPNLLDEERDVFTLYAHLSEIGVEEGDWVVAGQEIGRVGATGGAFGPHLHFEVRVDANENANTVNPVLWFAPLDDGDHSQMAMLCGLILDWNGDPLPKFSFTLEKLSAIDDVEAYYYPMTYYPADFNMHPSLNENFAVPDIPAGEYRLAFIAGRYHEYFFTLESGALGFITIKLD